MPKELSILLLAKDMASKTIGKVSGEVGKLGKAGAIASRGVRTLGANLAKLGAVAAVGIGAAVKSGIDSLAELESATTAIDGAIAQLGLTGQIAGSQVAGWANEIEASIGAAFDDKDITAAAATLLRFGKVTPKNLRPAMEVMTDLATKTGSVDSAASLLAKALADPTKAAGKLARSGVVLTKAQQDQLKAMVAAGKTAEAQAFILDELAKSTKGAALASQGPYKRALSVLADVTEDAQRALAEGFLPVLEKVAGKLSKALADPKVMANVREFGQTLAKGFDSLLSIAEKLPWGTIGDSLKLAGAGAKTILGAFAAMPPWVQTAVLTGWGLNKLTGGAIGGIVGELGKGLIKGVLGIQAANVNVFGKTIGGLPGGGGGAVGGAGGKLGAIASGVMKVAVVGMAVGVAAMLGKELLDQSGAIREQGKTVVETAKTAPLTRQDLQNAIANIDEQFRDPLKFLALSITNPLNGGVDALRDTRAALVAKLDQLNNTSRKSAGDIIAASNRAAAAITAKDFSPNIGFRLTVNTSTTVSVRDQRIATAIHNSYQGRIPTSGKGPVAS